MTKLTFANKKENCCEKGAKDLAVKKPPTLCCVEKSALAGKRHGPRKKSYDEVPAGKQSKESETNAKVVNLKSSRKGLLGYWDTR